jgi:5-(carboxyamino)imidazole ribonucleotide synthase
MINLLGSLDAAGAPVYERLSEALELPGIHPHLYGKSQVKPFRKMGHVTITGNNPEEVQKKVLKLLDILCVSGTEER